MTACSASSPVSAFVDAERTKPSLTRRSTSRKLDASGAKSSAWWRGRRLWLCIGVFGLSTSTYSPWFPTTLLRPSGDAEERRVPTCSLPQPLKICPPRLGRLPSSPVTAPVFRLPLKPSPSPLTGRRFRLRIHHLLPAGVTLSSFASAIRALIPVVEAIQGWNSHVLVRIGSDVLDGRRSVNDVGPWLSGVFPPGAPRSRPPRRTVNPSRKARRRAEYERVQRLHCGGFPASLLVSRKVFILNGGDYSLPSDFRISITSMAMRHLHKILVQRLRESRIVDLRQRCFDDGCGENVAILAFLLMDARSRCRELHAAFLDFAKAFDCVSHGAIINALAGLGLPHSLIDYVGHVIAHSSTMFEVRGVGSELSGIGRGVRQGDSLSPVLFCLVVDVVMRALPACWHRIPPRRTLNQQHRVCWRCSTIRCHQVRPPDLVASSGRQG